MKNKKLSLFLALILVVSLALTACGTVANSGAFDKESDALYPMDPMEPSDVPMEPDENYGTDTDYYPSKDSSITEGSVGDAQAMSEKIIRTISINAQTKEYEESLDYIRAAVATVGGFEETFRSTGKNYYSHSVYSRNAYMRLRIPADQLDAFLAEVGGMINILSQNSSADNVTTEYYDIKTRIGVLESERKAYEEMLKQSMDIDYLLQVKDRLYNVIEEIESYQTRLNLLDSKVAYSTVTISLDEVVEYTPVVTKEPTFGERVADAFTRSWKNFAMGCQNFAVGFVGALPTILIFAVIAAIVLTVVLKLNRKHRHPPAKKEAASEDKNT